MTEAFYALDDDTTAVGRWQLGSLETCSGTELDGRYFRRGQRLDAIGSLRIPRWLDGVAVDVTPPTVVKIKTAGREMDVTFAAGEVPVVNEKAATILLSVCRDAVQMVPAYVSGRSERYYIANVTVVRRCIDFTRSLLDIFESGNVIRPDLAGMPMAVYKLIIDPEAAQGDDCFRIVGWEHTIVVSGRVMNAFIAAEVSGVIFRRLTP